MPFYVVLATPMLLLVVYVAAPLLRGSWASVPTRLVVLFAIGAPMLLYFLSPRLELRRVRRLTADGSAFPVWIDPHSREVLEAFSEGEPLREDPKFYFVVFDDRFELWGHGKRVRKLRVGAWSDFAGASVESTQAHTLAISLSGGQVIVIDSGLSELDMFSAPRLRDGLSAALQRRVPTQA
jgi:hypothetical protein